MFNKERIKGVLTGVIITLTASTMLTVFANPIERAINVVYDNYKIIIDGVDKSNTPEDSKPFIYNGRTYVPLRYIGEAMGKKVLWDGDTKSIYINDEGNSREDVPVYDVDELALRLGTRQVYLYEEGAPLYGKYDQCEQVEADSDKYGVKYGDLTVLGSRALDGDIVQISSTNPKTFQKNGISLDKRYEELVAILGEPELGGPEQGIYWWTFVCDGYSLSVKSNDPAEAPYEVIVHF